jgi:hypothetical protein
MAGLMTDELERMWNEMLTSSALRTEENHKTLGKIC